MRYPDEIVRLSVSLLSPDPGKCASLSHRSIEFEEAFGGSEVRKHGSYCPYTLCRPRSIIWVPLSHYAPNLGLTKPDSISNSALVVV